MKLPFKAPSVKIPFLKRGGGDEPDTSDGSSPSATPGAAPFSDDTSYLGPSKFMERLPWIGVFAGYGAVASLILGTVLYLFLAGDTITQELIEARPKVQVTGDQIKIRDATGSGADAANQSGSESQLAVAPQEGASSDETSSNAAQDDGSSSNASSDGSNEAGEAPIIEDAYGDLLTPHPDPGLSVQTDLGILPKVGDDGREPWRVYARPYNIFDEKPKVAVIVTGLGVNARRVELALELHGAYTLAFAPYARKVDEWISQARSDGHEVMLTLPLEPADFPKSDPGPYALMNAAGADKNIGRLEWIMSRTSGYTGFVSYQGGAFAANPRAVEPLFADMKSRGLLYLDGRQTPSSAAPRVARSAGVPVAQADIVVDGSLGRVSVIQQLKLAESLATANKSVIVLADSYPVTLERLEVWTEELAAGGFTLVPLSAIIAERLAS